MFNQILSSVLSPDGISIGYISADDPSLVGLFDWALIIYVKIDLPYGLMVQKDRFF